MPFYAATNAIGTDVQAYDAQLDDLAGLAITKGNVIVADGSNWLALGVGTNDQVVTADSAEASGVKWADAAGGGSTATVGPTNGTYATVQAAEAASETVIEVIEDTTETIATTWNLDSEIKIFPGVTWDTAGIVQSPFGGTVAVKIKGPGEWTMNRSTGGNGWSAGILTFQDLTVTNNSTAASTEIAVPTATQKWINCEITTANVLNGGIDSSTDIRITNCELIGGGTAADDCLDVSGGICTISQLHLSGEFVTANAINITAAESQIVGLYCENVDDTLAISGSLYAVHFDSLSNGDLDFSGNTLVGFHGTLNNLTCSGANAQIVAAASVQVDIGAADQQYACLYHTNNTLTVDQDETILTNVQTGTADNISVTSDSNVFAGIRTGLGGGAADFTFQTGSINNTAASLNIDGTYTDNETNTVAAQSTY